LFCLCLTPPLLLSWVCPCPYSTFALCCESWPYFGLCIYWPCPNLFFYLRVCPLHQPMSLSSGMIDVIDMSLDSFFFNIWYWWKNCEHAWGQSVLSVLTSFICTSWGRGVNREELTPKI
jgi:hypothetical protein